jgi:U3 small nucleolar ribonucleoprotein component
MTKQIKTNSKKNKREKYAMTLSKSLVTVIKQAAQKKLIKSSASVWVQLDAQVGPAFLSGCLPT